MSTEDLIKNINSLYHIFYDSNAFESSSITCVSKCKELADNIKKNHENPSTKEYREIFNNIKQANKDLKDATPKQSQEFINSKQKAQSIINKILDSKND